MADIATNVENLLDGVGGVTVLAATKYATAEQVDEAVRAGIQVIGENRYQDAREKFAMLREPVRKHFIGHLQTNKVRGVVELFDCIESVDSEKLLVAIDDECRRTGKVMDVYFEVNISGEESKYGVDEEVLWKLLDVGARLSSVRVCGLMTMLPFDLSNDEKRVLCLNMKGLFDRVRGRFPGVEVLSMGMSSDYEIAIECGATEVRIGSLLFRNN